MFECDVCYLLFANSFTITARFGLRLSDFDVLIHSVDSHPKGKGSAQENEFDMIGYLYAYSLPIHRTRKHKPKCRNVGAKIAHVISSIEQSFCWKFEKMRK